MSRITPEDVLKAADRRWPGAELRQFIRFVDGRRRLNWRVTVGGPMDTVADAQTLIALLAKIERENGT